MVTLMNYIKIKTFEGLNTELDLKVKIEIYSGEKDYAIRTIIKNEIDGSRGKSTEYVKNIEDLYKYLGGYRNFISVKMINQLGLHALNKK